MDIEKNGVPRGAPRQPIAEPEEAPTLLSPGATAFHLPRSLLNPDNGREYGYRTYRCGGVDDRTQYDLCTSQGWLPADASEIKEFNNAHHLNVYADTQDKLARVQGQVVMYRTKESKQFWDTQNEQILQGYRATVARYRKAHQEDHVGPEAGRGYGNW